METKSQEQAKLTQEEQEHLQKRIAKITARVERAMSAVNDVMALMSTGTRLYKNTKSQLEKIQRDIKDLKATAVNAAEGIKNSASNIGDTAKNLTGQSLASSMNSVVASRVIGGTASATDSTFNVLDSGMGALNYTLSSADFLPNKLQQKISEKEMQRRLLEAQKKLKEVEKAAKEWIQVNTKKYTEKVTGRQKELQKQLNRQIQKAINSITIFTGADPAMLEDLIERAEQTGMAYATGKQSASDQLDNLIGFAKSSALNRAMNMATAKSMEVLDKSGFKDLANDIKKDIPAIKKITGLALEQAGIPTNLGNNIISNIKDRLNINL